MSPRISFLQNWSPAWLRGVVFTTGLVALASIQGAHATLATTSTKQLTISYSEKVGDELALWIANDAGYFKQRGLNVTLKYLPAQEGIPALLAGQIEMAAIGGSDALSAEAQGAKLKYVATFSPVLLFQFWARPKYAHASALKGQRVGVTSSTGSVYTATVISLRKLGLSTKDVALTPLGSVPNVNNALIAGSIVAAVAHPPATYVFKQQGFVKMVDLLKERIGSINTGLVAKASYVRSHPGIVQNVVDAVTEALHREKSDKAFTEQEMRKYMHVKSKVVADFTYNFYAKQVAPSVPMPKVSQLRAAKKTLSAGNTKMKSVDLSSMIDQSFVKKAMAEKNIK